MNYIMRNRKKNIEKKHNPYILAGSVITGGILILVFLGIFFSPYDPTQMNATAKLQGISLQHIMGTDHMGRDVFSRVLYGSRVTLVIAAGTVLIGAGIGTLLGALTGYFGGIFDEIMMRIIDALFAFPSVLLALVFVSLFHSGTYEVMIALGIAFIPDFCLSQTSDSDSLFIVETKEVLPERELVIAYNEKVPISKAAQEFLSYF